MPQLSCQLKFLTRKFNQKYQTRLRWSAQDESQGWKKVRWINRLTQSIPILTYHSLNVHENTYAGNDHIAFSTDLQMIDSMGMRLISLHQLMDWFDGKIPYKSVKNGVVVTLDDGSWLDFHDILHPTCGPITSMFNLIKEFQNRVSLGRHTVHISSFVISSPEARTELDNKNLIGRGWWGDDWWKQSQSSGLMSIECHSWDHNHYTLENVAQKDNLNGDFRQIDTYQECTVHTVHANNYIEKISGHKPAFFAYPWGQASRYAKHEFMPKRQSEHGYRAAFSIDARHVTRSENRWYLPRYVCGRDWKSPKELRAILK